MKTKQKQSTKIILSIIAAFALVFSVFAPTIKVANAYKYDVALTNPGFESDFSTGWKITGEQSEAVTSAIIETTDHNGETGKVYKISSETEVNYGIETTYSTNLTANSYYCLSVWAKANNSSTKFSFGVSGEVEKELTQTATTEWVEYKIFIQTESANTAAIIINLWLGSKTDATQASAGQILFDDVKLTKIDRMQYIKYATAENSISKLDLYADANANIQLISGTSMNWLTSFGEKITASSEEFTFNSITQNNDTYSKYVVKANNSEGSASISLHSQDVSLGKFGIYRVSVLVKAVSTTASFTIKLESGTKSVEKEVTSLSSTTTDNSMNGFTEYEFFVRTNYSSASTIVMTISVNSGCSILLDNAKVENAPLTKFSNGSNKLDLLSETYESITNGHFTQITKNSDEPKEAYAWSKIVQSNAIMGVVTSSTEQYSIGGLFVSIPTYYKISSTTPTYAGIKSNTFNTTYFADTPVAKISVIIKTTDGAKATVSLFESSNLVATQTDVSTNGQWQEVSFFIKTSAKITLSLQLSLGGSSTNQSSGEVDFYSASCSSLTEEDYNTRKAQNNDYELFWNDACYFAHNGVMENGVYELLAANYDVVSQQDESFGGVLDLERIDNTSVFAAYTIKNPDGEQKGEYLALYTNNGSVSSTHLSGDTTKLTDYVELTTKLLVIGSGSATINLGDLGSFTINADGNWHTLKILIKTGSEAIETIKPKITLESEGEAIVLADEVEFLSISENTYKNASETEYQKLADLTKAQENSDNDSQKTGGKTAKSSTSWTTIFFIALSSALLVGAVLAAVIAKAVKRLPKRTVVNIPNSGYGKNKPQNKKTSKGDKGNKKGFV